MTSGIRQQRITLRTLNFIRRTLMVGIEWLLVGAFVLA